MTTEIKKYFNWNGLADKATRAAGRKKVAEGKVVLKRTAQGVWEMGKIATELKAILPHGDFMPCVEAEWGLSHDSVGNFMRVYERLQIPNNSEFEASPTVLYMLAAPSVSDETLQVAIGKIQTGEIKTVRGIKALIAASKPAETSAQNGTQPAADDSGEGTGSATDSDNPGEDEDNPDGEDTDEDEDNPPAAIRFNPGDRVAWEYLGVANYGTLAEYKGEQPVIRGNDGETYQPDLSKVTLRRMTAEECAANPVAQPTPEPTTAERIQAMPLYQALALYSHKANIFALNAESWYLEEKVFRAIHAARGRHRHESGPVPRGLETADIPEPALWEGCAACKGSQRVGERNDPCQACKGGFTVRVGEGVSADVVSDYAASRSNGAGDA